jgi:hypothetical protein
MEKNERLSAAEAFVLLSLPRFDVRKALKLGFMGLLAQGVLRIEPEDRRGLFRTRHVPHLRVAAYLPANLSPIAVSLVRNVRFAEPDGLMRDVVRDAGREYGSTLTGFVNKLVAPALVARGLAELRRSYILGLIPRTRFFRTPTGEVERIRLENLMRDALAIPDYLDRDPRQAIALIAAMGGAILLVDELRPHYQAMAVALRDQTRADGSSDGGGFAYGDGAPEGGPDDRLPQHDDPASLDIGSVDFAGADGGGLDLAGIDFGGLDFSAFDAGAFDSFDAGFADAGGDGGGGDGGGDGGSSGC